MTSDPSTLKIFLHPRIYTLSETLPVAQWMVTLGNRILAVGGKETPYPDFGPKVEKITLPGKAILPGFTDAHCHLYQYLYRYMSLATAEKHSFTGSSEASPWLDLAKIETKQQFLETLRGISETLPHGRWILGGGWIQGEHVPNAQEIDKVAPHNPVFLMDASLHAALTNTLALTIAGITAESWDIVGGRIDRNPQTGEPNGFLFEQAVLKVQEKTPRLPRKVITELTVKAMRYLNQYGIVGIHDMESCACYEIFPILSQVLTQTPEDFTLRVLCSLALDTWQDYLKHGIFPGFGNEMLRMGGLKLIHDGSLGARTAFMSTPYAGTSDYRGEELLSRAQIRHIAKEAIKRQVPLAIHAIGDRAVQNIAEIFAELKPLPMLSGLRHRIEHIQSAMPDAIASLARSKVVFSVQPIHIPVDLKNVAKLAPHLFPHTHAYRTILEEGKKHGTGLALGTDFPVAPIQPLWNIYAAVVRQSVESGNSGLSYTSDNQSLTIAESVYAYTVGAAFAAGEENRKGSLAPGKLADFISLSQDILQYELPPKILLDTKIEATYVGARCVYP